MALKARAKALDVPRESLRRWEAQQRGHIEATAFSKALESPAGQQFLHRLWLAATVTFVIEKKTGERGMRRFSERARLSHLVASSKGTVDKALHSTVECLAKYEKEQEERWRQQIPEPVEVVAIPDEMFRDGAILVALAGASGFILVQKRAPDRKGETWAGVLRDVPKRLPVKLISGVGDEGSGLKSALENHLGIAHFSEVFHPQYEVSKACGPALARRVRQAEREVERLAAQRASCQRADASTLPTNSDVSAPCRSNASYCYPHETERGEKICSTVLPPTGTATRVCSGLCEMKYPGQEWLQETMEQQRRMGDARRDMGRAVHPYHLDTGAPQSAEQVQARVELALQNAQIVADEADLGKRADAAMAKARRAVPSMALQVGFWREMTEAWVRSRTQCQATQDLVLLVLLPYLYLMSVARKLPTAEGRQRLCESARTRLDQALKENLLWRDMPRVEQLFWQHDLQRLIGLYQRSSAPTEGWNGHLSNQTRARHGMSEGWLSALTVLHNYVPNRSDGTSPAERLFGSKPDDLFEYLVLHLPWPPRPVRARPGKPEENPLLTNEPH